MENFENTMASIAWYVFISIILIFSAIGAASLLSSFALICIKYALRF